MDETAGMPTRKTMSSLVQKIVPCIVDGRIRRASESDQDEAQLRVFESLKGAISAIRDVVELLSAELSVHAGQQPAHDELLGQVLGIVVGELWAEPDNQEEAPALAIRLEADLRSLTSAKWILVSTCRCNEGPWSGSPIHGETATRAPISLVHVPRTDDGVRNLEALLAQQWEREVWGLKDFAGESIMITPCSGPVRFAFTSGKRRITAFRDILWLAAATTGGLSDADSLVSGPEYLAPRERDWYLGMNRGLIMLSQHGDTTEDRSYLFPLDSRIPQPLHLVDAPTRQVVADLARVIESALHTSGAKSFPTLALERSIRALGTSRDSVDAGLVFLHRYISVECLLKTSNEDGVARGLAQLGAMLTTEDLAERERIHDSLRKATRIRNDMVHNGVPIGEQKHGELAVACKRVLTQVLLGVTRRLLPLTKRVMSEEEFSGVLRRFGLGHSWESALTPPASEPSERAGHSGGKSR